MPARTLSPDKTIGEVLAENISACVFTLLVVGIFMVMNATTVKGQTEHYFSSFAQKQITFDLIGLFFFFCILSYMPARWIHAIAPWLGLVSIFCLMAVLVFGAQINGARRWFKLGFMSFQPSEMAKIFSVIFFAWYLEKNKENLGRWKGLVPALALIGTIVVLIAAEPDLGNAALLCTVMLLMLYIAGARPRQLFTLIGLASPFLVIGLLHKFSHFKERILQFMDPNYDPMGKGYQGAQALIALGSGGLTGKGLGAGLQKFYYLPEAHNDFIFAIIGEDFGFAGCCFVILIYMMFIWYAIQVCLKTRDLFTLLVCFGFTFIISGQALFNLSVVTGLVPNKGISLPLVSYGGSNVLFTLIALAILIKFSKTLPQDRPRELGAIRIPRRGTALF